MNAKDVMTSPVISIGPEAVVAEVAGLLLAHKVSAIPVLDGEKLVGIVSEGDLIRRVEIGTDERPRSWWLRLFTDNDTLAREYTKSHAERVRDVMTRAVVAVSEETPLAEVAALFEKHQIKRLPVLREGRLVGIVSRADLIRGLAAARTAPRPAAPDEEIRTRLLDALRSQPWSSIAPADITVTNGLVELWGLYSSEAERRAARVAAESVAGVGRVADHRAPMPDSYGFAV